MKARLGKSVLAAIVIVGLIATSYVLEASTRGLPLSESRAASSSSSSTTAKFGILFVSVVSFNDSVRAVTHLPLTITKDSGASDGRALFYIAEGDPLEMALPANTKYIVDVSIPLSPLRIRVRVLGGETANLTIWVNQVWRRASSFEVDDPDSTGQVASWSSVVVHTQTIETPERNWNATLLLVKSELFPVAPYSDGRLVQTEEVPVSVLGYQVGRDQVSLRLRPSFVLPTNISSMVFLVLASGYTTTYSSLHGNLEENGTAAGYSPSGACLGGC